MFHLFPREIMLKKDTTEVTFCIPCVYFQKKEFCTVESERGLCLAERVLADTLVHPKILLFYLVDGEAGVELVVLHLKRQPHEILY